MRLAFDIEPTEHSVEVMRAREHRAESRSIARLLSPRTIAVVGASRTPGSVGHTVLRHLLDGRFPGPVYPVNPAATSVASVRAYPSVLDIPDDGRPRGGRHAGGRAGRGGRPVRGQAGVRARRPHRNPRTRRWTTTWRRRRARSGCGWWGPPRWASSPPGSGSTPPCRPSCPRPGRSASSPSRDRWARRCSSRPSGAGSASRRSSRPAIRPTSAATPCCSTGRRTRPPAWWCSTSRPSATPASSPGSPGASAGANRSWR